MASVTPSISDGLNSPFKSDLLISNPTTRATRRGSLPETPSEASPEGTLSETPSKTPSGRATPKDPFRSLSEYDTCSQKPLSEPSRSPAECPFEASVGTSFGNFRRMPRVPKVTPKALRNLPPFRSPSEHAGCPESQPGSHPFETSFRTPPFGLSFGKRHVSRVPIHRTLPEASECAASPASDTSPGSLRVRHVSRVPKPGESLRMSPESPRVPSARAERPLPGTFRVHRVSREPTPRDHPGHSASTPRVPGSVSFSAEF